MRPYRFASASARQRAEMLENHYQLQLSCYPQLVEPLYLAGGIELGRYPQSDCAHRVTDGTFRREVSWPLHHR